MSANVRIAHAPHREHDPGNDTVSGMTRARDQQSGHAGTRFMSTAVMRTVSGKFGPVWSF